jgi:hypothetical protein
MLGFLHASPTARSSRKYVATNVAAFVLPALFALTHCGSRSGEPSGTSVAALGPLGAGTYTIADASSYAIDGGFYHWSGTTTEELYALSSGNNYQQWQLNPSGSGFTICNVGDGAGLCLSDGGSTLSIGVATDVWTVSSSGAGYTIQNQRTGMYIADPSGPANGAAIPMSSSPSLWTLQGLTPPFRAGVYTAYDSASFAIDGGYFHWSGTQTEELYSLTSSNTYQQWQFTAKGSGFTICNVGDGAGICLSDGGTNLEIGAATDAWTVIPAGAGYTLQNQRTGRYVSDPASPGDGEAVPVSPTPTVWRLGALDSSDAGADGGPSEGGNDGGDTGPCTVGPANVTVSPSTLAFGSSTLGEATTKSLLTVMNTGAAAVHLGTVSITGADAGDFSEQTDCPTDLPAGEKCYVRVVFAPTQTGSRSATVSINSVCTSTLSATGVSLASGFYLSPTGNDSTGDGSLASPWQTLPKAQQAMQASGGAKMTTYLRAGIYTPVADTSCDCMLNLGNADNGETWSYYPADGVDSAIIEGGSTGSGVGPGTVLSVAGASHVTFDGLTVRNFDGWGFGGVNSSDITVKNSVVYNGYSTAQYGAQGIACGQYCVSWSVLNNVMHDITGGGANIVSAQNGSVSNLIYAGNFVYNTCTSPDDGGDCGALYAQDNPGMSTNIVITGNFVRDGNPWRGMNAGSAIYLDDCLSNATVTGNVITGTNGNNTTFIHGGMNDVYMGNIIDLGTYAQNITTMQTSASPHCNVMTGNAYTGNVVISQNGGGGYGYLSWPLPNFPVITNNLYYAYAGSPINSGGDSHPVTADPELSGCYSLDPASPAYQAPVNFSPLLASWGPPGYHMPVGASIPPSYPSPTCK